MRLTLRIRRIFRLIGSTMLAIGLIMIKGFLSPLLVTGAIFVGIGAFLFFDAIDGEVQSSKKLDSFVLWLLRKLHINYKIEECKHGC